jgi:predicted DNA-binding ribbon-helix-helix protein
LEEAVLKSLVAKRSVVIGGHKTSVSLEDPFWNDLKEIAYQQKATLSQVVEQIDRAREHSNLSSAIRLFVLDQARAGIVGSTLISRSPKLRTG